MSMIESRAAAPGDAAPSRALWDGHQQVVLDVLARLDDIAEADCDPMEIEGLLCLLADLSSAAFLKEEVRMDCDRVAFRDAHASDHSRVLHVLDALVLSYETGDIDQLHRGAAAMRDAFLSHARTYHDAPCPV